MARKSVLILDPKAKLNHELSKVVAMRDLMAARVKMEALKAYARLHGLGHVFGEPAYGGTPNAPAPMPDELKPEEQSFEERMKARTQSEETKG